jgi:vitamin B12 transporter
MKLKIIGEWIVACSCSAVPLMGICDVGADSSTSNPVTMVITPDRIETTLREVANSVSIVSEEEIAAKGASSVAEALRDVPGVDVVRSGGPGGNSSIFLRGTNSEHTLVLIDGVEANNPISTNRSYNFADLGVDEIEKIEILRGPQSTVYGSDAIGGVINIITKKSAEGFRSSAAFEGGSRDTFRERATLGGASKQFNYSLGASRQDIGGISAADSRLGNEERDRYEICGGLEAW